MAYIVNNGQINGEVQVGYGLGSRLRFRGRIFTQEFKDWVEIREFKHYPLIHDSNNLGANSVWGKVDAFLREDGVFEHQYPKHEYLILGTFCRYARQLGSSMFDSNIKFQTKYDTILGLIIITERDGKVYSR